MLAALSLNRKGLGSDPAAVGFLTTMAFLSQQLVRAFLERVGWNKTFVKGN